MKNPVHALIDSVGATGDALNAAGTAFVGTWMISYHKRTVERATQAGIRLAREAARKAEVYAVARRIEQEQAFQREAERMAKEGPTQPKAEEAAPAAKKTSTNGRRTRALRAKAA